MISKTVLLLTWNATDRQATEVHVDAISFVTDILIKFFKPFTASHLSYLCFPVTKPPSRNPVIVFSFHTIFFLNSVLRPFQDYFSSYETGQSVGGAKTGEPREKPPDTPASRTWLVSHIRNF